jgi:predicted AAA+ superfamily ATPase
VGLSKLQTSSPVIVFDGLHKYRRWRTFLKGFFDRHASTAHILVTGSSRLDFYRKGGDSLMGRYFTYRLHPLSIGELLHPNRLEQPLRKAAPVEDEVWERLLERGGFPEPYVRDDRRFSLLWQRMRAELLVRGDVRDLTRIQEVDQLALLVRVLATRSGSQLNYTALATEIRTSVDTMRRWIDALCSLYHGFLVRPWFRNVARSLRKEPKWFLRDWSAITDVGARAETLVACHLLKAVQVWEDLGLGVFGLHYLRDKDRREVDFLVTRDDMPWFLVEVKAGSERLSPCLSHFQEQTGAEHAFQLVLDAGFVDADPFARKDPCVVPARTLLSQLP